MQIIRCFYFFVMIRFYRPFDVPETLLSCVIHGMKVNKHDD